MAGRGPAPKGYSSRDRDQARRNPQTALFKDGEVRGPELPADAPWHDQTIAWYETWRRSEIAQLWTDTDWDFLVDTAVLHTQFWMRANFNVGAELRQRVAKLGATVEDRQRLRVSIDNDYTAIDAVPNEPTALDEYRKSLGA